MSAIDFYLANEASRRQEEEARRMAEYMAAQKAAGEATAAQGALHSAGQQSHDAYQQALLNQRAAVDNVTEAGLSNSEAVDFLNSYTPMEREMLNRQGASRAGMIAAGVNAPIFFKDADMSDTAKALYNADANMASAVLNNPLNRMKQAMSTGTALRGQDISQMNTQLQKTGFGGLSNIDNLLYQATVLDNRANRKNEQVKSLLKSGQEKYNEKIAAAQKLTFGSRAQRDAMKEAELYRQDVQNSLNAYLAEANEAADNAAAMRSRARNSANRYNSYASLHNLPSYDVGDLSVEATMFPDVTIADYVAPSLDETPTPTPTPRKAPPSSSSESKSVLDELKAVTKSYNAAANRKTSNPESASEAQKQFEGADGDLAARIRQSPLKDLYAHASDKAWSGERAPQSYKALQERIAGLPLHPSDLSSWLDVKRIADRVKSGDLPEFFIKSSAEIYGGRVDMGKIKTLFRIVKDDKSENGFRVEVK